MNHLSQHGFTNAEAIQAANQEKAAQEKMQHAAADDCAGNSQTPAQTQPVKGIDRSSTLTEEALNRMRHHAEAHSRSSEVYDFLSRHPEFDEFVRLVRAGLIPL